MKKNKVWVWNEQCKKACEDLKVVVIVELVLVLPNFSKTFKVHMDALDYAAGGVLMQERHLIAFESCKLNETERRFMIQEKEMAVIVHNLRT